MKKILIIFLIIVISLGLMLGLALKVAQKLALFDIFLSLAPSSALFPKADVLVVGIDDIYGHRTDTIMVLHHDPDKNTVSLISIPRDTLTVLPDRGLDKINHAYAYGGIELTRKTVENLLQIKLPYYVLVNLGGLEKLIDGLGGITLDIKNRMYYVDYAGNLFIDLKPGLQKLSGQQAVGFLRYRTDGGDLTRISRQQQFLNALAGELAKRENLFRSPQALISFLANFKTNLKSQETLGLCLALRSAHEQNKIKMQTLSGTDLIVDNIYYLRPDENHLQEIINQLHFKEGSTSLEQ